VRKREKSPLLPIATGLIGPAPAIESVLAALIELSYSSSSSSFPSEGFEFRRLRIKTRKIRKERSKELSKRDTKAFHGNSFVHSLAREYLSSQLTDLRSLLQLRYYSTFLQTIGRPLYFHGCRF